MKKVALAKDALYDMNWDENQEEVQTLDAIFLSTSDLQFTAWTE